MLVLSSLQQFLQGKFSHGMWEIFHNIICSDLSMKPNRILNLLFPTWKMYTSTINYPGGMYGSQYHHTSRNWYLVHLDRHGDHHFADSGMDLFHPRVAREY